MPLLSLDMFLLAVVSCLYVVQNVNGNCDQPLGLSNVNTVRDKQFYASSHLFDQIPRQYHYQAHYARLNGKDGGGAWCSSDDATRRAFLEVDLRRNMLIRAILTQGRYKGTEYVTQFHVTYQRDFETKWRDVVDVTKVRKNFQANNDTKSIARNDLPFSIIARKVRIYPSGDLFRIYCMRLELLGCNWNKDFLFEYEAPPGVTSRGYEFRDLAYDGALSSKTGRLSGGLGEMVDGNYGDKKGYKAVPFIGYTQEDTEIVFKLRSVRLLEKLTFYVSNIESMAELYRSLTVEASTDGRNYEMVSFLRGPTRLQRYKSTLDIAVNLNRKKGSVIKATFKHKPGSLLLISEVDIFTRPLPVLTKPTTQTTTTSFDIGNVNAGNAQTNGFENPNVHVTHSPIDFSNSTGGAGMLVPFEDDSSNGTKTFYIIVGVAIFLLFLLVAGIVLLFLHFRRDKRRQKRMIITRTYPNGKPSSCESTLCEPLLKLTEFQGASGTSAYTTPDGSQGQGIPTKKELPRTAVDISQRIGGGKHGEVFSGQIVHPKECISNSLVQSLVGQRVHICVMKKGASLEASVQFTEEVRDLACLNHANICRLLGVCSASEPLYVILEASDSMRLDKYLYSGLQQETKCRRLDILNDIARQLASALVYLGSIHFVHRDIAVRNVLCNSNGCVKLSNTAAASAAYYDCYYYVTEKNGLYPIRWMSPEAIACLQFSSSSDVWSFGIMLWEMYMLGSNRPLACFSDTRVIAILREMYETGDRGQDYLQCPQCCPSAVYELMKACWRVRPDQRVKPEGIADALAL